MIKGFAARETEEFFRGRSSRRIPADAQVRALRKLLVLNAMSSLDDLGRVQSSRATVPGDTRSASTTGGGCASSGGTATPTTWKSRTIIVDEMSPKGTAMTKQRKRDIAPVRPGEVLKAEFSAGAASPPTRRSGLPAISGSAPNSG